MKLVTFYRNGENRLGVQSSRDGQEVVYDLNRLNPNIPDNMIDFLSLGEKAIKQAVDVIDKDADDYLLMNAVKLLSPVLNPEKIICIGLNYRDHAEESNTPIPDYPTIFSKYANSIIGTGEAIVVPKVTDQVDWECELGVVIGKECRHVKADKALGVVGGYLAVNDVSARDYQTRTTQWTIGKTFDTFCPMGPALVTTDEITDPGNLDIRTVLDGEVMQHSNTGQLIFSVPDLIAYLSDVMTLKPGDVISTGTPSGVGFARNPKRYLEPGQVCRVEIEGIGMLENPVVAE